jgi:hypothetical protein
VSVAFNLSTCTAAGSREIETHDLALRRRKIRVDEIVGDPKILPRHQSIFLGIIAQNVFSSGPRVTTSCGRTNMRAGMT